MKVDDTIDLARCEESVALRPPIAADARAVWQLVEDLPDLDSNSPYAYLLLCTHFADTGLVACLGSQLVGFVLGYARPDDGSTAFVWQVGVSDSVRRRGVARRLLDGWFARCARRSDVRFLEATVTRSNRASRGLFSSFAARRCAPLREHVAFPRTLFPESISHEDEVALRIGPVPPSQAFFTRQERV